MKFVACVAAVGEDGGYRGKALQSVDDKARRAIAVLNVGAMDARAQKIALRDGYMTLAALGLLARAIARYAAAFDRPGALAVNDRDARTAVAARDKAAGDRQKLAGNRKSPIIARAVEMIAHDCACGGNDSARLRVRWK